MSDKIIGSIYVDFRILEVSSEIRALKGYFNFTKKEVSNFLNKKESEIQSCHEADERDYLSQVFQYDKVIFPRLLWNSFLLTLYAVLETSLIDIAKEIQKRKNCKVFDGGRNNLKAIKKYYRDDIFFEIDTNHKTWEKIRMLKNLRHAIAHSNGRVKMLNSSVFKSVEKIKTQDIGVSYFFDYIIINERFIEEIYQQVEIFLEDLVARYKKWDTANTKKG